MFKARIVLCCCLLICCSGEEEGSISVELAGLTQRYSRAAEVGDLKVLAAELVDPSSPYFQIICNGLVANAQLFDLKITVEKFDFMGVDGQFAFGRCRRLMVGTRKNVPDDARLQKMMDSFDAEYNGKRVDTVLIFKKTDKTWKVWTTVPYRAIPDQSL